MGNEKQALVKKQVVFVKSDCSCPRALLFRQDSPRIGCIRWTNRVYCNPIFICGGRGAHVRFVSGRSLAGAERRHGSGADGDIPGADRRLGCRLLPPVRRIGRAGGSAGPAGSRPLWPQAGGPAGRGWCGLLPALLHGCLPHTGGVHRRGHRSTLPCPHRRAGPWAGTAGGRPVPGSLCLLLFLRRAGGQPPAAGPPRGPCRRPGCRGTLLLSSPAGAGRALLAAAGGPVPDRPAVS